MEKEIGKLYVTDDYGKFELIVGNRFEKIEVNE